MNSGRTAFNDSKYSFQWLLLAVAWSMSATISFAQTDSTFSVMRNGAEARFPFTKFTKAEQFKTVRNSTLPIYIFNKPQFTRIKGLLVNFAQIENDYRLLLANHQEKDSIFLIKEKTLVESAKFEQERAKNFQSSYNSLLVVNTQLNDQVNKAEQLAIHEHKKRKLNSILLGALAFSVGVVLGVTIH